MDASFPGKDPCNISEWRINVRSKSGSHIDVAKLLHQAGENGLSFMQLARKLDTLPQREKVVATGKAGTIYLCHPGVNPVEVAIRRALDV